MANRYKNTSIDISAVMFCSAASIALNDWRDYIFSLAHKDEEDIFLKADIKNRGIKGYQFLKDLLGPDKAKILKLHLYGNL